MPLKVSYIITDMIVDDGSPAAAKIISGMKRERSAFKGTLEESLMRLEEVKKGGTMQAWKGRRSWNWAVHQPEELNVIGKGWRADPYNIDETLKVLRRNDISNRWQIRNNKIKKPIKVEQTPVLEQTIKPVAIKPEVVNQQVTQKPIVTASTAHTITTIDQSKVTINTPDLSQQTRRENISAKREDALKPNKDVLPETRQKKYITKSMSKYYKKGYVYDENTPRPKDAVINTATKNGKTISINHEEILQRKQDRIQKKQLAKLTKYFETDFGRENVIQDVTKGYNYAKKIWNNPWTKRVAGIGAGLVAFNFISGSISRMFSNDSKAIPDEYERGYDIIKEHMTDFGSPLHLAKAAQKVIMPYYSTVRRSVYRNTSSIINGNLALSLSKNAIKHTSY